MAEVSYIQELINKAKKAQSEFENFSQEQVDSMVKAMGKVIYDNAEMLAKQAVEESGYGRVDSKILKLKKCTLAAWHFLHDKKSVGIIDYDPVEKLATFAKPVGVVATLVPTTNPVSTTVSNGMNIIKCRNAMIVSPHPRTKAVTMRGVEMMNAELKKLGAPDNLIQVVENPTMDSTQELMKSADVVVATGGAAMVKSAYSSGRPSFGVGPGNIQAIVDEKYTDYDKIASNIVANRAYDNGMPCTGEQAIHIHKNAVKEMLDAFVKKGAYILPDEKIKELQNVIFKENGAINPANVGMTPTKLGKLMGLDIPEDRQIIVFKCPSMSRDNWLRREKLCPVVQYFTFDTFKEGVANAKSNLLYEGAGHSSIVYTDDTSKAEYAGVELPVSRILVNQPGGAASGGNFINGLKPTMSLGCGSWGNNSISDNLTYINMMNTTKLAYYHDSTLPSPQKVWEE